MQVSTYSVAPRCVEIPVRARYLRCTATVHNGRSKSLNWILYYHYYVVRRIWNHGQCRHIGRLMSPRCVRRQYCHYINILLLQRSHSYYIRLFAMHGAYVYTEVPACVYVNIQMKFIIISKVGQRTRGKRVKQ